MRIALISPLSPAFTGNGAAHRAAFWQRTLARLGDVTTIVVPLIGPSTEVDDLVVAPHLAGPLGLPELARHASAASGLQWAKKLGGFDLVVAFRSYTALFAAGLCVGSAAPLIVDLDDDDADFARQSEDEDAAGAWERLIEMVDRCAALTTIALDRPGRETVHNTVELPVLTTDTREDGEPVAVIVANFGHQPNLDGARWFVAEVLPLVLTELPDLRLRMIGRGEAIAPFGIGFVADLPSIYSDATVALVPLLRGSGTRIKAIEAWAHGVPVVGTSIGLDGLNAVNGEHALIGDTAADFADDVIAVLQSPSLRERLATAGRRFAESRYSSVAEERRVAQMLSDLIAELSRSPMRIVDGLQITEIENGLVIEEPITGQVHHLNATAAIVFSLIDGTTTDAEIAAQMQDMFALDQRPDDEVAAAITAILGARIGARYRPAARTSVRIVATDVAE